MNKPTLAALAVFVVLLIAFVATREKEVSVGIQKFEAPALSSAAIEKVAITGANTATLERSANGWTVADPSSPGATFPADDGQVQSLLTALAELKAPDFVSDKAEKHAEYEVDSAKGTTVTATAAGKTFAVVLGKPSKSGGVYVRKADGAAVFASSTSLGGLAKRNVQAWRKKTITTAPMAEVTQVDVARADGEAYALKADEGGAWTLASATPPGFRFDATAGLRLVTQLTALTAQDFLTAPPELAQAHRFTLTLKDGKTVKVSLGATKRDDGTFPLVVEGDAQPYAVASWVAEQLDKPLEGLRDLALLAFDPTKATRLTITVAGKKTVAANEGGVWKLVEPSTPPPGLDFDSNQVGSQLGRLRGLRAVKLAPARAALGAVTTTIEILAEGKPVKLVFGADTGSDSQVYVKGNADDALYVIAGSEKAMWGSGPMLFNRPPPPPDFGQMQGLEKLPPEIREKLLQQLRQQRN